MSGKIHDWGWIWRDTALRNTRLLCTPLQTAGKSHCSCRLVLTQDQTLVATMQKLVISGAGRHLGQCSGSLHCRHA